MPGAVASGSRRPCAHFRPLATQSVRSPAALAPPMSASGLSPTIHPPVLRDAPHSAAAASKRRRSGFRVPTSPETQMPSKSGARPVAASLARWMSPAPFVAMPRVHPARRRPSSPSRTPEKQRTDRATPSTYSLQRAPGASLRPMAALRYTKSSGYARSRSRLQITASASWGRERERTKPRTHFSRPAQRSIRVSSRSNSASTRQRYASGVSISRPPGRAGPSMDNHGLDSGR